MTTVQFGPWTLTADVEATRRAYKQVDAYDWQAPDEHEISAALNDLSTAGPFRNPKVDGE